jgi:phosphate acetyltransferase
MIAGPSVSPRTGPTFIERVRARAARRPRRIVFPESADLRVRTAVEMLARERIVEPVVLLDPAAPHTHAAVEALGIETIDPLRDGRRENTIEDLLERRAKKGLTEDAAAEHASHPLFFADAMVRRGEADGCVAGCVYTTADVLRAALWLIGPASGVRTVSSAFYMVTSPFRGDESEVLTFTDCAVIPYPTSDQLVDIALAAAADRRRIVGDEPCVAMLSFSTAGSGAGASVDLVRDALERLRATAPTLLVDGELQGDAALIPAVGNRKAPRSPVAGRANVLVFPSLDAGNIAYKLVERIAHAAAIGPIIQGLARPCSDLSRGASPDDIVNVAAITALQAGTDATTELEPSGRN